MSISHAFDLRWWNKIKKAPIQVEKIALFRVAFRLCFKARPSAKPFIWKLVLFTCKWIKTCMWIKLISCERLCTGTCFETGSGLLGRVTSWSCSLGPCSVFCQWAQEWSLYWFCIAVFCSACVPWFRQRRRKVCHGTELRSLCIWLARLV